MKGSCLGFVVGLDDVLPISPLYVVRLGRRGSRETERGVERPARRKNRAWDLLFIWGLYAWERWLGGEELACRGNHVRDFVVGSIQGGKRSVRGRVCLWKK